MTILSQKDPPGKSQLDDARVKALLQRIAHWGGKVSLTSDVYRSLRWDGWTRGQVDRAIERLIADGRIVAEVRGGVVSVRIAGGGA